MCTCRGSGHGMTPIVIQCLNVLDIVFKGVFIEAEDSAYIDVTVSVQDLVCTFIVSSCDFFIFEATTIGDPGVVVLGLLLCNA